MTTARLEAPLPIRTSYRPGACVRFDPATRVLAIDTDPGTDRRYSVTELSLDRRNFDGRAFVFLKLAEGSDPEADSYTVFLSDGTPDRSCCSCRGFLRYNAACCHLLAAKLIVDLGWLDVSQPAGAKR